MGRKNGKREARKDPILIERLELLMEWLESLDTRWKSFGLKEIVYAKYCRVPPVKILTSISVAHDLILSKLLQGNLRCADPLVARFVAMTKAANSSTVTNNVFFSLSAEDLKACQKALYRASI